MIAIAFSGKSGEAIKKALKYRADLHTKTAMTTVEELEWRGCQRKVEELNWIARLGVRAAAMVSENRLPEQ